MWILFLGEILGAVLLGGDDTALKTTYASRNLRVSEDGELTTDQSRGNLVRVLESIDSFAYYNKFAAQLGDKKQSAVIGSFEMQKKNMELPTEMNDDIMITEVTEFS